MRKGLSDGAALLWNEKERRNAGKLFMVTAVSLGNVDHALGTVEGSA